MNMRRWAPRLIATAFLLGLVGRSFAFESFLPPDLRAPERPDQLVDEGESPHEKQRTFWSWRTQPEFGPHSDRGTGLEITEWRLGPFVVGLNLGLQRDPFHLLEQLRETDAASPYPLFRVDPAMFLGASSTESSPFRSYLDLLNYRRFVCVVLQF
jgi:hypothetical protein